MSLRVVAIAAAALVMAPSATQAQRRESTCAKRGSETIRATTTVRVFRAGGDGNVYGCAYGRRPLLLSGFEGETTAAQQFAVVGHRIAYAIVSCDRYSSATDGCEAEIRTADVRTRRKRVVASYNAVGGVGSLVLSAKGAVAAILNAHRSDLVNTPARVVVARGGAVEVADSGDDIDPRSLALGGRTLYWLKAGRPMTLDLP